MILGVGFLVLVVWFGWLAVTANQPLLWLFSLGLVAAAAGWLGAGPGVFGKRTSGDMPGWNYPLHVTWYLLSLLSFYGRLALSGEDAWNPVADNVWVGRRLNASERQRLHRQGVYAILDMTAEFPGVRLPGVPYRCLPVLDGTAPSDAQLDAAVAWIAEHQANGPVYVHCAMGHGRSATAVVAWMLSVDPSLTVEAAQARLRVGRPGIRLAPDQKRALRRWKPRR